MKEIVSTKQAPEAIGSYSQAVKYQNTVFLSGQIALDPETGDLMNDSTQQEVHRIMSNLESILQAADSSMDKVLKVRIFMTDMDDYGKINEIYGEYFGENSPARAAVEVSDLPLDARVEIEMTAGVE